MMGPNAYPRSGHDWIEPAQLEAEARHTEAQLEEKYTHELMDFRADVWRTLAAKGVLVEGDGWAIFTVEDDEGGNVVTADQKEIMVIHVLPRRYHPFAGSAACLRLITNERLLGSAGQTYCLTEDVMIDISNTAAYSIDAVLMRDQEEGPLLSLNEKCLPLFAARSDGDFRTNEAFPLSPVPHMIGTEDAAGQPIKPFGSHTYSGRDYALAKAKALFEIVRHLDPTYQSVRRS